MNCGKMPCAMSYTIALLNSAKKLLRTAEIKIGQYIKKHKVMSCGWLPKIGEFQR